MEPGAQHDVGNLETPGKRVAAAPSLACFVGVLAALGEGGVAGESRSLFDRSLRNDVAQLGRGVDAL